LKKLQEEGKLALSRIQKEDVMRDITKNVREEFHNTKRLCHEFFDRWAERIKKTKESDIDCIENVKRGLKKEFLDLMKKNLVLTVIYSTLQEYAIKRSRLTYRELIIEVGNKLNDFLKSVSNSEIDVENLLSSNRNIGSVLGMVLSPILGAIVLFEWACGRPLLPSIVYNKYTEIAGAGFDGAYELVREHECSQFAREHFENYDLVEAYLTFFFWGNC
jgi:hypothetical protein